MAEDIQRYENLFNRYYSGLVVYATRLLGDRPAAEDIVCDTFTAIWEHRHLLHLDNIKAYLFTAVRNRALNYLQQLKVRDQYQADALRRGDPAGSLTWEYYVEGELRDAIHRAIDTLPPRCRDVFTRNRLDGQTIDQIAAALDISPRTVEKHLEVALDRLRTALRDYLPALAPFVLTYL